MMPSLVTWPTRKTAIPLLLADPAVMAGLSADGRQRSERTCDRLRAAGQQRGRITLRQLVEGCWLALGGPALLDAAALADAERVFDLLEELDHGGDLRDFDELEAGLGRLFATPDLQADGQLQIMTIHKAKGLEWDKVYLLSVNDYDFPSALPQDSFISEAWFVRDHLNLEAETLAQLDALTEGRAMDWYQEGAATLEARQEFIRERLRLFYVGVTRARRWLTVTANSGRASARNVPARAFLELINAWEKHK